jgi:hypothetical protein
MSTDMDELFSRDPLGYSKQDREEIIRYMREARERMLQGDKKAGSAKTAAKPKEVKDIDLGELGL